MVNITSDTLVAIIVEGATEKAIIEYYLKMIV